MDGKNVFQFENNVVDILQLPKYEDAATTPIEPNYRKVILLNTAVVSTILLAIGFGIGWFLPFAYLKWLIGVVILIVSGIIYGFEMLAFERRSYAVRDHDVIYKRGVIAIKTTIVPYHKIQHVAVIEGVFSRIYRLATVKIYTAGGSDADIAVAGLAKETAEQIKELILQKLNTHNEDDLANEN